jgi:hypothetical protein
MKNAGRSQSHNRINVEGDVPHATKQSPGTSARWVACHHISQQMVVKVLHDQPLNPFHVQVQHVQALQLPLDYKHQKAFANDYCSISNLSQMSVADR